MLGKNEKDFAAPNRDGVIKILFSVSNNTVLTVFGGNSAVNFRLRIFAARADSGSSSAFKNVGIAAYICG